MRADMHVHTLCSDGSLTTETVVKEALKAGLGLVAVTDHDTTAAFGGLCAEISGTGLKTVTGAEISAYDGQVKFHTLGYGMDLEKFKPFTKTLYEGSLERAGDIVKKLNAAGYAITLGEALDERYDKSCPVHGGHFARALLKKGLIARESHYYEKLSAPGKPAFSAVRRPTPEQAVEAINAAGGIAVLAHPGRIRLDEDELERRIEKLALAGLGGIEVYYTTHTEEKTVYYGRLADRLGLLKTGGSDTHRLGGARKIGVPRFEADGRLLERLKIV